MANVSGCDAEQQKPNIAISDGYYFVYGEPFDVVFAASRSLEDTFNFI